MITRLCLLVALAHAAWAQNTLIINANVITIEKHHPSAQAFAFDNGRFTAVGTNAIVLDLHGMTVTPGFNDAHLHPQAIFDENSPYYRVWLGGDRVRTISDLVTVGRGQASGRPRMNVISDCKASTIIPVFTRSVAPGSTI